MKMNFMLVEFQDGKKCAFLKKENDYNFIDPHTGEDLSNKPVKSCKGVVQDMNSHLLGMTLNVYDQLFNELIERV